ETSPHGIAQRRNSAFDLVAAKWTVSAAVYAAVAIISHNKILVIGQLEGRDFSEYIGKGIGVFAQVRLAQQFAVDEDVAPPHMDSFPRQGNDSFEGVFFVPIIDQNDVAAYEG